MMPNLDKEVWWLMYSSFPNLNWARLRVYNSEESEVFDMDGKAHLFKSEKEATDWLLEDVYTSYNSLDGEDENEYGIELSNIKPPSAECEDKLKDIMYVTAYRA